MIETILGVGGWVVAGGVGFYIAWRHRHPPSSSEVQRFMKRVVDLEVIEEHEHLTKLRMMRNQRKSTRVDGGPNAKVTRMRVKKRG